MMRNLQKIRLTVLSAVLGAFFIMSEKSSEAAVVVLETSKGQVEIEMKPELAPNHVARITELVKQGFYDGIIFHRVIQDLWPKQVIQQEQAWADRVKI